MSDLKKWQLLSAEDVSPSVWLPIQKRTYKRPDGTIIDDFYVTTLADSVYVVPLTTAGRVVMIRLYKQGTDEIMIQFPAGRFEPQKHSNLKQCALDELAEETGIRVALKQLTFVGTLGLMTTKATERVHLYLAQACVFNSTQNLDDNEEIEIVQSFPSKVDQMITSGEIWDAPTIASWHLVKSKFSNLF